MVRIHFHTYGECSREVCIPMVGMQLHTTYVMLT